MQQDYIQSLLSDLSQSNDENLLTIHTLQSAIQYCFIHCYLYYIVLFIGIQEYLESIIKQILPEVTEQLVKLYNNTVSTPVKVSRVSVSCSHISFQIEVHRTLQYLNSSLIPDRSETASIDLLDDLDILDDLISLALVCFVLRSLYTCTQLFSMKTKPFIWLDWPD